MDNHGVELYQIPVMILVRYILLKKVIGHINMIWHCGSAPCYRWLELVVTTHSSPTSESPCPSQDVSVPFLLSTSFGWCLPPPKIRSVQGRVLLSWLPLSPLPAHIIFSGNEKTLWILSHAGRWLVSFRLSMRAGNPR